MKIKNASSIIIICLMLCCFVATVFAAENTEAKNVKKRTKIAKKSAKKKDETTQTIMEKRFQCDSFRMTIDLPENWRVIKKNQTESDLSIQLRSPDKSQTILIYAFRAKEKVNIEDLADADVKLLNNLGSLESEKSFFLKGVRTFFFFPTNYIEKIYKSGDQQTKLVFRTNVHYAYIFGWRSKNNDTSVFDNMTFSYEPLSVSLKERWANFRGGIGGWLIVALMAILFGGIVFAFGQMGLYIRKGFNTVKYLEGKRVEIEKEGKVVNEIWHQYKRKAYLYICIPLVICICLYGALFAFLSIKHFLISLLGIGFVLLGYFGIRFGPDIADIGEDTVTRA